MKIRVQNNYNTDMAFYMNCQAEGISSVDQGNFGKAADRSRVQVRESVDGNVLHKTGSCVKEKKKRLSVAHLHSAVKPAVSESCCGSFFPRRDRKAGQS